jgi:hypothetical protein
MKINHYIVGFTWYNALILLNIQRPRVHHGQWMQESTGMTFRDIFTSHRVFPVQAEGFNRVRVFRGHATVTGILVTVTRIEIILECRSLKYRTTLFYIKFSILCDYFNLASWTWTWVVVRVARPGTSETLLLKLWQNFKYVPVSLRDSVPAIIVCHREDITS